MPTPWQRDLERDRKNLAEWLRGRIPDARGLEVSEFTSPGSSGFSNDTLLGTVRWKDAGGARSLDVVVRVQPIGYQVFPEYDLSLQFETMRLLEKTDVPVPRVLWLESDDSEILGAPFYLMERVEGRVPTDQPPYHTGGWMTEISPEERGAIWWGGIECLAKIHRVDPDAAGFGFLDRPELGERPFLQQLHDYDRYFEWAAAGRSQPTLEAARSWLAANEPADERRVLLWGDARIGNVIFDGTRPAAVLDWEMVTLGSPEEDLGWMIFLDRHHSEGLESPRLEGFPSYEASVARYQELSGHTVSNLHFWQVFCGWRFSIIMLRIAQQMVHYELMDEAAGRTFELDNTVTRLLARTLHLPAP